MESIIQAIEIFAAVTGVVYLVLEILQKNVMWVVGILTSAACAFSFAVQHVWASMCLNIYYMVVSVIGLYKWKKDSEKVQEGEIHLGKPSVKTWILSALLMAGGTAVFYFLLKAGDGNAPLMDAAATVLSAIATWWLAMSYPQQWLLFIVADTITVTLCLSTGQPVLAVLYFAYIIGAVYGWIHWKKHGKALTA